MPPWYLATQAFGPDSGEAWTQYLAWSKLAHLAEVVSLDQILCPEVLGELTAEDWQHNVQADFLTSFFTDLDYLLGRAPAISGLNILAVIREPELADVQAFQDARFQFQGYDLVERPGAGVSALVNCGGFERAFQARDLNPVGLLPDLALAKTVQQRLLAEYPGEQHADCFIWALWRMKV